ncbi:MAG TPA: PilZ domain-containing protein [Stenomitos sp.]
MAAPRPGSLAVVSWEGEEVVGEVVRVDATHATVAIRIPHDIAAILPPEGRITWANGRQQSFRRGQATAVTVVEIAVPLAELKEEGRAEVHLVRRVAVDVRSVPEGRLVATGHTQTLSGAGARLELNRPLKPDERVRLSLFLPEGVVKLDALVLRSDQGPVLVTFQDMSDVVRQELERYLRESVDALRRRAKE